MVQPLWKTVCWFLTKLNVFLPHEAAITLLVIHVHTKTSTKIFIIALFIIVKTLKQPRCPSAGERINKL